MNQKLLVLVCMVSLLFILSSCSGGSKSQADFTFKRGVQEAGFKFMSNAPPSKVYQNSPLAMMVELDNNAAYEIYNVKLELVGLDETHFLVADPLRTFDRLQGRGVTNPIGDKRMVQFDVKTGRLESNEKSLEDKFVLQASYESTVEFFDSICLNPHVYTVGKETCQQQSKKSYSGQGAPLAVSNLELITYPSEETEIELRITLRNRGKGKIDHVTLGIAKLGAKDLKCSFQGYEKNEKQFTFGDEKEATLICRSSTSFQGAYVTTVSLDFTYDYTYTTRKTITLVQK